MKSISIGLTACVALMAGIVSTVDATVIDVVTVGVGDMGHAGTIEDPLVVGEYIGIEVFLNHNPYPGYPSYDGYLLSSMDIDLDVTGAGSLQVPLCPDRSIRTLLEAALDWNAGFAAIGAHELRPEAIRVTGVSFGFAGPTYLVRGMGVQATGNGNINVSQTIYLSGGQYSPYKTPAGDPYPGVYPDHWIWMVEADLGDLVIYAVPEPIAMLLLSAGGTVLMRKRRL